MEFLKLNRIFSSFLICFFLLGTGSSRAEDVCATVKMEIIQELTFERVAFDARMKITNGLAMNLENIRIDVFIEDEAGNDVSSLFFTRISSMDKIAAIDGTGIVHANDYGEIHWLIIPSAGAGGITPAGKVYYAGATLGYTAGGNSETMEVEPDQITVKPQPLLVLDYFMPRYVYGDDPYTQPTEPPEPYDLGVRIRNIGYGPAWNLKIDSGQPKIVDNAQGLLVDFRIIRSYVNGVASPSTLKVEFGDIASLSSSTARWEMISTLTGRFVEFDASFTHADELGGELTSLIETVNAHVLVHNIQVDLPGRDTLKDFLGETDDAALLKVWESDNHDTEVADVSAQSSMAPSGAGAYLLSTPMEPSFLFVKLPDPTQGRVKVQSVYRSDGKAIKSSNFWSAKERHQGSEDSYYFALFDTNDSTGSYTVTYNYSNIDDTTPPLSEVVVTEPHVGADPVYINENTEFIFLTTDDETGIKEMKFNIDEPLDGSYEPVVNPFKFSQRPAFAQGAHTMHYYAVNTVELAEEPQTLAIYLDSSAPENLSLAAEPAAFTPGAPLDEPLERQTLITYGFTDAVPLATAVIEIARGTEGYFDERVKVASFSRAYTPGLSVNLAWDGKDSGGNLLAPGIYSIRLTANDGLGHIHLGTPITVEILSYLDEESLAPAAGDQMYPDIFGDTVVWQEMRAGNWNIYIKAGNDSAISLSNDSANQERPAIGSGFIVWQDDGNSDWDIFYYNRATGSIGSLSRSGDQENPDIDGNWLVYQDNSSGDWEIYACDLSASTPTPFKISDGNERDQIRPSISGQRVAWEDYRFGKPEIYLYDSLPSGTLSRITVQESTYQSHPVLDNDILLWVDTRHEQNDLYIYAISSGIESRLTYQLTDQVQPTASGGRLAYVEMTGVENPDLSWGSSATSSSAPLVVDPARQEEPALSGNRLVWQDNRLGRWQIYGTTVTRPDLILDLTPGLNLVTAPAEIVNDSLSHSAKNAFNLLAVWHNDSMRLNRLLQYDATQKTYREVVWNNDTQQGEGQDFSLRSQQALAIYTGSAGRVEVPVLTAEPAVDLIVGLNTLGRASLPAGYKASDLIKSLGIENVRSLRAYDTRTGSFRSLAVEEIVEGQNTTYILRGRDFTLNRSEGLLIYMTRPVNGWRP